MRNTEQRIRRLAYRIGYLAGWRWSEIRRRDPALRDEPARSHRSQDGLVGAIVRRIGIVDAEDFDAIRASMNDAIEGRQPRW
jgi:hypothetical protein